MLNLGIRIAIPICALMGSMVADVVIVIYKLKQGSMIGYVTTNQPWINTERQFEQIAAVVTEQIAELLCAPTLVVDSHGTVIAHSEAYPTNYGSQQAIPVPEQNYLRVPVCLQGQPSEVIVGAPLNGEVISARLTQVLVERVISQTNAVRQPSHQHELKNSFIYNLLHGLIDDEAVILREAKILGMDLAPPRAVILIDAAKYILNSTPKEQRESADAQVRRRAQHIIGSIISFFHLPNDTICAYIGDGEIAVLKASDSKNLCIWVNHENALEQLNPSWMNLGALQRAGEDLLHRLHDDTSATISMGIGRYHPGVCGLARSYQDARAALSLGRRFQSQNGVYCLDRLGIAAFVGLSDERTKIELATYLLSPLDHAPDLLRTLDVFFKEDCVPSTTAHRLSVHRNTLSYRLDKITSLIGLNPRRFDDAVQIRLALLLRSFRNTAPTVE